MNLYRLQWTEIIVTWIILAGFGWVLVALIDYPKAH